MAAGVLIVEEAGGKVTCMDGGKFSVVDRSVLVSNGVLHGKLLERIARATEKPKITQQTFDAPLSSFFFVFVNRAENISSTGWWSLIVALVTFAVSHISSAHYRFYCSMSSFADMNIALGF
ncbi:hypothetical protein C1H46_016032 [Malus baccata]|uniref:Inositol monophosphatase n=1 Tax=Malus baccata TaxID=106549 RepID=A0A540MI46_MALBA|nr:hypothetical protein C1H46_016032 [Malus baccata]